MPDAAAGKSPHGTPPDQSKQAEASERTAPSGRVVYEAIFNEGDEELRRETVPLAWSGLSAGLSMGFSLVTEGVLRSLLPDTAWRPLIAKLGYPIGFLIVILGRQQLFTENTLTVMLPLFNRKRLDDLLNVARLWTVVLLANLVGAAVFAWVAARTPAFDEAARAAFQAIGHEAMAPGPATILLRGIIAGWLIAVMVWLLPFAETARVSVVVIVTYVIGITQASHVIAGSVETLYLVACGDQSWWTYVGGFLVPALAGNILGGVMLVAAVVHAQHETEA